jgi:hypothetical protein
MKIVAPSDLLKIPLQWEAVLSESCSFRTIHDGAEAQLLINIDFPDSGPYYRLTVGSLSIEFDDAPAQWKIPQLSSRGPLTGKEQKP